MQYQYPLLEHQFKSGVLCIQYNWLLFGKQASAEDNPSALACNTQMGDLDGGLGFWFWSDSDLTAVARSESMYGRFFSHTLSHPQSCTLYHTAFYIYN